ncbi:uncharacterized protein L969DRAFT_55929 [Mixia osmundae IAM 14324]|uniref:Uncharacterized protein n=1 Tax=Mixia osmundae (strain CBS 9802 / IAM 14324 / JCM 22182 / KY 12970) TaxID=764103 RepID=G7E3Q0_MIXOS|nr:uncharacterized protein L969DRAFT_55929 [Mixia osmundae IAM 14324]KEI41880.1 hypothetical protein L969DRAFT_55929 [Mixia osmundae IAM 14324]GAA97460.1 hypothetical protein E5Q_04139 [Mixia osmundae IAM 14324]
MRVTLLDLSLSALLLSTCACAPRQTSQYRTAIKGDGFGNILGKQFSYTSGGEHRVVLKIGPGVTLAGWSFDRLGQSSDKVNAHSIKELAIDTATAMSRVIAVEIRADIEGQFDLNNPIELSLSSKAAKCSVTATFTIPSAGSIGEASTYIASQRYAIQQNDLPLGIEIMHLYRDSDGNRFLHSRSGPAILRLQDIRTTREYWRADWVPRSPVARNAKVWAIGNKDHSTDNVIARTVVIQTPMEPWLKPLPDDEMGRLFRDCCDPLAQHTSLIQWPRKDPVNETCKGIVVCYPSRGAQCAAMWPEEFTYDCTTQCDTTWPWAPSG